MAGKNGHKIILFLGAGASAPFGYPTTQGFLDGLKVQLGTVSEGILLNSLFQLEHIQDIEHVLEILTSLKVFSKHPLKEFVARFKTSITLSPNLSTNLSDQLKIAETLEDRIHDDIYRQYEFSPSSIASVDDAFNPFLSMISAKRGDQEIPIYTTNYDRVIEEYSSANGLPVLMDSREVQEQKNLIGLLKNSINPWIIQ